MKEINKEQVFKVLLSPYVSEKSTLLADEQRQFVFRVASSATKPQVREAVEKLFDVEVASVRISNVKGKTRRFGQITGRRKGWKKAYVALKDGFDINFATAK